MIATEERRHCLLELSLRHLAMTNPKAQFGAQLTQVRSGFLDRLDAVMQIEGLSTTLDFASQRACNLLVVVLANVRVNGTASTRWRGDDRDIA